MTRSAIPAAAQTTRKHCSHSSADIAGSAVTRVKLKSAQRFQERMDPRGKKSLLTGAVLRHTQFRLKGALTGSDSAILHWAAFRTVFIFRTFLHFLHNFVSVSLS